MTAPPTALILVDLQTAFLNGPHAVPHAARVMESADLLLSRARSAGALVVHLQNDGGPGAPDEPEAPGWSLALTPAMNEPVMRKQEDDGFVGTDLAAILEKHAVRILVLCGVQSEMCVAATARGAMARGLGVVLPRAAHGSYDIPADGDRGIAVPAAHVSRVAEWSLGDEVVTPDEVADVQFDGAAEPKP